MRFRISSPRLMSSSVGTSSIFTGGLGGLAMASPREGSLLGVTISSRHSARRLYCQLSEREFAAVGFVMVHWALVEDALHMRTAAIAKSNRVVLDADATSDNFSRRLRAMRKLVTQSKQGPAAKERWLRTLDRLSTCNGQRQRLAHGLWSFNAKFPDRLWSSPPSRRPARLEPFDEKKMLDLGNELASIAYALRFPSGVPARWLGASPSRPWLQESMNRHHSPTSRPRR